MVWYGMGGIITVTSFRVGWRDYGDLFFCSFCFLFTLSFTLITMIMEPDS